MRALSSKEGSRLLRKHRIPYAKAFYVTEEDDLEDVQDKVLYPVALKIDSPDVLHKTDEGGVILNLKNAHHLHASFLRMKKRFRKLIKKGTFQCIIQEMYEGTEVIIGGKKDPSFGHVIMFGLGGVFVEVLKDVSLRITPVSKKEALSMIKEIKGFKLLEGYRGYPKANVNKLAELIVKLSNMLKKNPDIIELDFNPVMVKGSEITVVDARIIQ